MRITGDWLITRATQAVCAMLTEAGIYAVYPHRRYLPAKVRAFVDFLADWFKAYEQRSS